MELMVFKSLWEEINDGWIWIPSNIDGINSRDLIKVIRADGVKTKSIICVARIIDDPFVKKYLKRISELREEDGKNNSTIDKLEINMTSSIVISEYYRDKLGSINHHQKHDFEIKKICKYNFVYQTCALLNHPNNFTNIAGWLAVISIFLSLVGISITIITTCFK